MPVEERLELGVVEAGREAADALPEPIEAHQAGVVDRARTQRLHATTQHGLSTA